MPRIDNLENGNLHIHIPIAFRSCGARRTVTAAGDDSEPEKSPLALSLARAFRWEKLLSNGDFASAKDIAAALKIDPGAVTRRLRMTRLSPKIIHRILSGDIPAKLTDTALRNPIPELWKEQEERFL